MNTDFEYQLTRNRSSIFYRYYRLAILLLFWLCSSWRSLWLNVISNKITSKLKVEWKSERTEMREKWRHLLRHDRAIILNERLWHFIIQLFIRWIIRWQIGCVKNLTRISWFYPKEFLAKSLIPFLILSLVETFCELVLMRVMKIFVQQKEDRSTRFEYILNRSLALAVVKVFTISPV